MRATDSAPRLRNRTMTSSSPYATNVLVVDDVPFVRDSTAAVLSDEFAVVSAACAEEALLVMARTPIDVVCADLVMPGMGGLELLRRVGTMPGHIGRILVTGYSDFLDRQGGGRAESVYVLIKPYQPEQLCKVVQRAWRFTQLRRESSAVRRQAGQ